MTYLDSAEGVTITKARAFQELRNHGVMQEDFEDFLMDIISYPDTKLDEEGNIVEMQARDVLFWLGY
jgi:hypothetical protein